MIKNCWVVNHDRRVWAGIAAANGRIVAIGNSDELPQAARVIDAEGRYLLPGAIDPHQHLGFVFPIDSDWRTETRSAAVGGVTTVFNYLWHAGSYVENFQKDLISAERNALVDFVFETLMVSPHHNEEIHELALRGVSGFKWFTCYKGDEGAPWGITACDDGTILDGFRRVAALGPHACAKAHAENIEIIARQRQQVLASGRGDLAAWADSRPGLAEGCDIEKLSYFARKAGTRLVILHISSSEGVDALIKAKREGTTILGETCPHYLSLTKHSAAGVRAKVIPPIQGQEDQDKLWWAIETGVMDSIGSDHAPTRLSDKTGDVWQAKQGFPGTATILPVMLSEGVNKRGLPLEKVVEVTSYNNARWYGLFPKKGVISVGSDADLVLVDLEKRVRGSVDAFKSASDYCLHEGIEFQGWPVMTIVRGRVIVDNGTVVGEPGWGQLQRAAEKVVEPALA